MNLWIACLAGFLSGIAGSLGLGGGGVLIIFLTVFMGVQQMNAQGINLMFFIPIAIFSVIIYYKDKLIDYKKIYLFIITGVFGVLLGAYFAEILGNTILRKIFAVALILLSIKEFFGKEKNTVKE